MNISRATIISGPALITYGGQKFWSKGDVTVTFPTKRTTVSTAHFGRINDRPTSRTVVVNFEPSGRITTGIAAVLWPYAATLPGESLFGSGNRPLVIHGTDNVKLTVVAAAVTGMPNIRWSTNNTQIGPVTFTGLTGDDLDPSDLDNLYLFESEAYPGNAGFNPAEIAVTSPRMNWLYTGDTPALTLLTEAGAEMRFALSLQEHSVDGLGVADIKFQDIGVTVAAIPVNVPASELIAYLEDGMDLGNNPANVSDMIITPNVAPGIQATLKSAYLTEAQLRYGQAKRIGQCVWTASRGFTQYAAGPPEVPFAAHPLFAVEIAD